MKGRPNNRPGPWLPSVTHSSSQSDQRSSQRDALLVAVRPALVAAWCTSCRSATSTRRGVTHIVSQYDQHSSRRDVLRVIVRRALVVVRHEAHRGATSNRRSATWSTSRCVGPSAGCAAKKAFCDPLTSRRGEPTSTRYKPHLERDEGLAANGGTRILNKDPEVRTECGSWAGRPGRQLPGTAAAYARQCIRRQAWWRV